MIYFKTPISFKNKSIYVSHLLETLAQSAGAEVVKKAALLAEGNEWIDSSRRFL